MALVNRGRVWTYLFSVVLAWLVVLVISRQQLFLSQQMNADHLWQASFVWDVLHHPYAWRGFQLSDNLNIFPDLISSAALQIVLHSWRWAVFISAVLRFLAFSYLGGWIVASICEVGFLEALVLVEGVFAAAFLAGPFAPGLPDGRLLYGDMLVAGGHSGGFILALALVAVWLRLLQGRLLFPCAIAIYAVATLAILSDRLLWLEYVLPSVVVSVFFAVRAQDKQHRTSALGYSALVCAAVLSAALLQMLFTTHQAALPRIPSAAELLPRAQRFWDQSLAFARAGPLHLAGTLVMSGCFLEFPALLALRSEDSKSNERALLFWWYAAIAIAGCTLTAIAFDVDGGSFVYLKVALFVLVPIAVAVIVQAKYGRVALRALSAVVAVVASFLVLQSGTLLPGSVTARPELANCLAVLRTRFDLRAGLADYWRSRPLMMDSEGTLQVDQISADGRPYHSTNDLFWYLRSFEDPSRPPPYRFIIIRSLGSESIWQRYREPDRIWICDGDRPRLPRTGEGFASARGPTPIWIYDDPVQVHSALIRSVDPAYWSRR